MENSKLEHIGPENLSSISEFEENGAQKISVSHQINGLGYTAQKASDSFTVDIERFASLLTTNRDINANSRITLQRSLSRKGSQKRGGDKKNNSIDNNRSDNASFAISPRVSTPEKPMVVVGGATEQSINPQVYNPITIKTNSLAGPAESKSSTVSRRFSFRRSSSPSWTIDPRRILFFFATLSSMGTLLLIYLTLSMNFKFNGDENVLN